MTDIRKVEDGLRALFRELHGDGGVDVVDVAEINAGWEARIVGFRLVRGGESTEMVARIYSGASAAERVDREFQVMIRLFRAGYPVPEVYVCYTDSDVIGDPFMIMERLPGVSFRDDFLKEPEKMGEKIALFSMLFADLHALSPRKTVPFDRKYRTTHGRLEYRIENIAHTVRGIEIGGLDEIVAWLEARRLRVSNISLTIIHQDFHPGNILFRRDGAPVIIDWSAADLGDPREDLAWTKLLASTFFSPELGDAFVAGYTKASGRRIDDLDYFEVLEILRRLSDAVVVLAGGVGASSLRSEVEVIMRHNRPHYLRVIARLKELMGLEVPEVARLIS